ncbi:MAG: hypothetical protein Q7U57_12025 [Methylovulum sp.]|nr:hypothetical protein [Methylovulum sp.]
MITITIDTNKTQYYQFSQAKEVARILRELAKKLESSDSLENRTICDSNCNKVGYLANDFSLQPQNGGPYLMMASSEGRRYRDA